MSGFFKRFKSGNQETTNKERKDESSLDSPSMDLSGSEGLSLFSGMTFSSDVSSLQTVDQHQTKQTKPPSKELAEAGLDFNIKEPLIQSTKPNLESRSSSDKSADNTLIDEEISSNKTTHIESSVVQHGKKKKKTHAKRPGYARDAKSTVSVEKKGNSIKSSEKQEDNTSLNTATEQEQSNDPLEHPTECVKAEEKVDKTKSNLPDEDFPPLELDDSDNAPPLELDDSDKDDDVPTVELDDSDGNGDNSVQQEIETTTKDFHQLYSIGTPTSSEENLTEDVAEPQEEKTKCLLEPIKDRKSDQSSDLLEGFKSEHDLTNANLANNEHKDEDLHHDDALNLESKTINNSSAEHEDNDFVVKSNNPLNDIEVLETNEKESNEELTKSYDFSIDAEDKFIMMKQDMQFRISSLKEDEECMVNLTTSLIEKYSNMKAAYLEKQKQLDNLVQEESTAIAGDNYDLAEELAIKIEQAKDDLENAKYKVPAVDVKVQKALKLASELALRTLSIRREAQSSLEELREEQVVMLDNHHEEKSSRISKEKQQLNLEKQRIERTRAHLQLDTEHLEKEESLLEEEINEKTDKFVSRKKELIEEKQQVKQEIADLEERLVQLRLKEAQCREEINAEEDKIAEILKEFVPQRDALDLQRNDLENQQRLLKDQQQALTSSLEVHSKSVDEWQNRKTRLSEFLESLQASIESNNLKIAHLEKKRGEMEEFQCLKHLSLNADPALNKLRSSAKRSNQQIKTLQTKINLSNRTVVSLRTSLSEIEAQISDRNEAKDIAKKERNFKEAKRLKEESEALNSEGIESQKKLENILQELNKDNEELKTAEKEFEKISGELKDKEFESDVKLMNSAAQVVQELESHVHRYTDNDLLCTLLNAEISTCQNLIKELCLKHDIDASECREMDHDTNKKPLDTEDTVTPSVDTEDTVTLSQNLTSDDKESLQNLLDELEVKLEVVVDLEDFDEAERIQQQIDELKSRLA